MSVGYSATNGTHVSLVSSRLKGTLQKRGQKDYKSQRSEGLDRSGALNSQQLYLSAEDQTSQHSNMEGGWAHEPFKSRLLRKSFKSVAPSLSTRLQ